MIYEREKEEKSNPKNWTRPVSDFSSFSRNETRENSNLEARPAEKFQNLSYNTRFRMQHLQNEYCNNLDLEPPTNWNSIEYFRILKPEDNEEEPELVKLR